MNNKKVSAQSLGFDPFGQSFISNPYPVYQRMRDDAPIFYYEPWDMVILSRYDDIRRLVVDKRMVRTLDHLLSEEELAKKRNTPVWKDMPNHSKYVKVGLLDIEGEAHERLRKLVFKVFTPAAVASMRSHSQAMVDRLISAKLEEKKNYYEMDFIEDLASKIPGYIIGLLLGVPESDRGKFKDWSEDIVQFFDVDRTREHQILAEEATTEFADYLTKLIGEKQKDPQDDLITILIRAEQAGQLNREELIALCMLILSAGHGSTIDVLGTGLLALLRYPEQMLRLKADLSLLPSAVQEMFRYDSPLPFFHRYNCEDMEFRGQFFPKGSKFGFLYSAANHDPEQFKNADKFDVGRQPNRHMAFGGGAHFCLGNHLSRMNMEVIFGTLLRRLHNIELREPEPEFKPGLTARGLTKLPVCFQVG